MLATVGQTICSWWKNLIFLCITFPTCYREMPVSSSVEWKKKNRDLIGLWWEFLKDRWVHVLKALRTMPGMMKMLYTSLHVLLLLLKDYHQDPPQTSWVWISWLEVWASVVVVAVVFNTKFLRQPGLGVKNPGSSLRSTKVHCVTLKKFLHLPSLCKEPGVLSLSKV